MNTQKNSSNRWINIGIVAIIALLAVNAWLFYDKYKNEETIEQQSVDLGEAQQLNMELEKQYYETLSQLEEMRGDNEEMNTLIDKQKEELRAQKEEITKMISTTKDYKNVRSKLKDLETQAEGYLAELDALREANALLTEENSKLGEEKRFLEDNLQEQIRQNDDLTNVKATLVTEKSKLENQNQSLNKKVTKASVIPVQNIDITGYKVSDSGKESKKRYANNIDRLKICFDAAANAVTEPGDEAFYIRIIAPNGQTLAVDEMGSGILNTADGEQVRFTAIKEFDYNQTATNACLSWEPGAAFDKGNYQVEVYNKGHLAGTGTFKLK